MNWPAIQRPFIGTRVQGYGAWHDLFNVFERAEIRSWALESLEDMLDQLHRIKRDGWAVTALLGPATTQVTMVRSEPRQRQPATATSAHRTVDQGPPASDAEFATLCRAFKAARRHGLTLPPERFRVRWFDRDEPDQAIGFVDHTTEPIEVWLSRGLTQLELFRTVVHELQHVADWIQFGAAMRSMSKAESERRADAFMWRVTHAELGAV